MFKQCVRCEEKTNMQLRLAGKQVHLCAKCTEAWYKLLDKETKDLFLAFLEEK